MIKNLMIICLIALVVYWYTEWWKESKQRIQDFVFAKTNELELCKNPNVWRILKLNLPDVKFAVPNYTQYCEIESKFSCDKAWCKFSKEKEVVLIDWSKNLFFDCNENTCQEESYQTSKDLTRHLTEKWKEVILSWEKSLIREYKDWTENLTFLNCNENKR